MAALRAAEALPSAGSDRLELSPSLVLTGESHERRSCCSAVVVRLRSWTARSGEVTTSSPTSPSSPGNASPPRAEKKL